MSRAPRYAQKKDDNESEIVNDLEKIGASVEVLGSPVDLLVGYRARNFLIEVKNAATDYGKNDRGTGAQRQFFADWKGQVRKAYTSEEAIDLITSAYEQPVCDWKSTHGILFTPGCRSGSEVTALQPSEGVRFCPWCGGHIRGR